MAAIAVNVPISVARFAASGMERETDLMNKIKVALIFEDKSVAKKFALENAPDGAVKIDSEYQFVYETSILYFDWIKPSIRFKGQRVNFVYTTGNIRDTPWFDAVIRPMQMVGTGAIDQKY